MVATYCLCAIVALVPLPFGSTNPRVIAIWVLLLSAVLGLASLRSITSRDVMLLAAFATIVLGWSFVVFEQLSQAPLFSAQLIDGVWDDAATVMGHELRGSISLSRNQPHFSAGPQIACMLSIICGFLVGRDHNAARLLLLSFAVSGVFYALYGILAFTFWPGHLLWQEKFNYGDSLVITFANPNVAAVYLGSCTMVWLLMLATKIRLPPDGQPVNWRNVTNVLLNRSSQWTVICAAASLVGISAMFMTGSRAGSILSLLAISGAAATFYRRQLGRRGLLLAFPLYAISAIIVAFQVFGSRVNQRFESEGLFDAGRWNVYLSTLKIIGDHPWLGTGLGTFHWVFPRYRSADISIAGIWEQAHSTTLEVASEMGIPFTLLAVTGWLAVLVVLWRGILVRKRDEILPLVAFWVGLLALVHSQVDFSLQIPGFSIAICILIGMGLAQSVSSRRGT